MTQFALRPDAGRIPPHFGSCASVRKKLKKKKNSILDVESFLERGPGSDERVSTRRRCVTLYGYEPISRAIYIDSHHDDLTIVFFCFNFFCKFFFLASHMSNCMSDC